MTAPRHALREPMMWLVILLPAAVVVAGFATLFIAIGSGSNDAVSDRVRRTAQIQTAELGPEERARTLGLVAVLQLQPDAVRVLPVQGEFDRDKPLLATFAHPVRADADIDIELLPDANGWRADIAIDMTHDWRLQLAPRHAGPDADWRIHGRLPAGQQAAHLASSLHDGNG